MGFIEKRSGGHRARYGDPLGRLTSKTFTRKANAERWPKEMEVAIERGDWLDPRSAQVPLATWAEEYLSLARRLSPSTQETYERDLRKYILPRFGAYRLGRLPGRGPPGALAGPGALVFANTVGSPLISSSFWQQTTSRRACRPPACPVDFTT